MDIRFGKHPQKYLPIFALLFKVAIVIAVIISLGYAISRNNLSQYFPIKTVRVYGVARVDQSEVENVVAPLANHGFFSVNVEYIRDRLLQMPWVSSTFVRRYWPDRIDITIVEKNAIARWNDQSLLSDSGEIFVPEQDSFPNGLPVIVGPNGQQMVMLQYFNQINRLFTPLHTRVSHLELTSYASWKLMLDNGLSVRIGHKDILTRLGHFVKVYPKIIGNRASDVQYIDLRYSNGMAVRWKNNNSGNNDDGKEAK
jgi:cell division protein FtsQ